MSSVYKFGLNCCGINWCQLFTEIVYEVLKLVIGGCGELKWIGWGYRIRQRRRGGLQYIHQGQPFVSLTAGGQNSDISLCYSRRMFCHHSAI